MLRTLKDARNVKNVKAYKCRNEKNKNSTARNGRQWYWHVVRDFQCTQVTANMK